MRINFGVWACCGLVGDMAWCSLGISCIWLILVAGRETGV